MQRRLFAALIVAAHIGISQGICSAQQVIPAQPSASARPAQDDTQTPSDQVISELQTNADDVSKQSIPDKDVLLLRELDRIDAEIARVGQVQQKAISYRGDQATFANIADRITKQSKILAGLDCQDSNAVPKFQTAMQSYSRVLNELFSFDNGTSGMDVMSIVIQQNGVGAAACNDAKARASSQDYQDAQSQVLSGVQKALTDFLTSQNNLAAAATKYIDALKKRRVAVQDKLNASQPAFQIGSNLGVLVLILGGLCVATILGIKLFDPTLQMEWVASGQVIQFVTVMILLIVILALGLSSILHENTLGTLLGGIAGYVLAQGVGRSAARDVARNTTGTAGPPGLPGPPGPPAAPGAPPVAPHAPPVAPPAAQAAPPAGQVQPPAVGP